MWVIKIWRKPKDKYLSLSSTGLHFLKDDPKDAYHFEERWDAYFYAIREVNDDWELEEIKA